MSASPFILPEGNVQIAFSGGRTSAYMLHHILEANGGLRDDVVVSFQNTGREMPQTLDFVEECGSRWGVRIAWLEYRHEAPFFEVVSHNSASRDGEPFDALIDRKGFLPNKVARFCTTELKVRPVKRYLLSLGWEKWVTVVGIRADEPSRLGKDQPKERWTVYHPLASAGVTVRDVAAFWHRQPFDLRLPNVRGNCPFGNCDGCFLKSERTQSVLARDFPERHQWWESAEARVAALETSKGRPADNARFSMRFSKRELRDFMERQGDWALSTEGALCQTNDGECFA